MHSQLAAGASADETATTTVGSFLRRRREVAFRQRRVARRVTQYVRLCARDARLYPALDRRLVYAAGPPDDLGGAFLALPAGGERYVDLGHFESAEPPTWPTRAAPLGFTLRSRQVTAWVRARPGEERAWVLRFEGVSGLRRGPRAEVEARNPEDQVERLAAWIQQRCWGEI